MFQSHEGDMLMSIGTLLQTDVPPKAGPNPHVDLERGRGAPIALPQATAV